MKKTLSFAFALLLSAPLFAQNDTTQKIISGRKNSVEQQNKPYVILISADGFRYDYAEKYHADHLLALADEGVKAPYMLPSYPSVTFPNHYTITSGLYPAQPWPWWIITFTTATVKNFIHQVIKLKWPMAVGMAVRRFGYWQKNSRCFLPVFIGLRSEAPIQDTRPSYYYVYNDKINIHTRIQTVVGWLKLPAEIRPHFIAFYFPQVDHAGHNYGP